MTDTTHTQGILAEAEEKGEALLQKARTQAASIIAEAKKKADKVRSEEEASRNVRLEMIRDTEKKAIEGLDRVYALRHEENAVDKVMKMVSALEDEYLSDGKKREQLLSDLVTEAALAVGTEEVVIFSSDEIPSEMLSQCEGRLLADFGLAVRLKTGHDAPSSFGVIASDPEGRIIYDDTLSTRTSRLSREIRQIVGEAACRKE